MGGSEDGVPVRQKKAAKISAAKSTVIAPPQSRTAVGFDDGAAAALTAISISTGEDEKDSLQIRKLCNMADLDMDGGDRSSSAVSNRSKLRKMFHNVAEEDGFLSEKTVALPCPSCNDLQLEYVKPVVNNVNGSLMIPSDVVNRGSLPYSRTLYGYFIEETEIAFSLVDCHIRKMWKTHGIEDIMVNHKGFYFFKFKTDQGMLDALENGPWTIGSIPIFLKRWTPGLILDKSKHGKLKLPVWIRIYDMPLELWNKEGLNIVASMLGNPLALDTCTARMCMNASGRAGYARVLVDFEATGTWLDEISVSVPYGNGYSLSTLRVEYSWKPAKCSFCKVFDHTDCNCIHQKTMAKEIANQCDEISTKKEEEEEEMEEKRIQKAQAQLRSCQESQCLKTLKVVFHHATKEEPVIHNIRMPKQSTIGDVLNEIKTKVELSHPDAELRLLQVFHHKIYKIYTLTEKIENIDDEYWTLRAEEIPEEEKNMGPKDRLIHVYHFTKEAAQKVQNFGKPFFLIIHENETLSAVKFRIQRKLEVPDDEFAKWKFAFVSLGFPKYLKDSDVVCSCFQRRGFYAIWEQYLGLEHHPLKAN